MDVDVYNLELDAERDDAERMEPRAKAVGALSAALNADREYEWFAFG
jgi:hypothetical protein